ncbi:MAG: tetratricopeptide repeat protein [Nostoc sp.]
MRLKKVILSLVTILVGFTGNFTVSLLVLFSTAEVLLQTSNPNKVEADRLNDLGLEQLNKSQFQAALQSWEQALDIYRKIKDRQSEGKALLNLGLAYIYQGDSYKAIENLQQSLAIARQIKNTQIEGKELPKNWAAFTLIGESN